MIFEIIDILKKMIYTGFTTMIPISLMYAFFVYILLRDNKEMEIQNNQLSTKPEIEITPYYLTYYRKPLHNKFKNNDTTMQIKHKNRKDRHTIRQRRLLWKNYCWFLQY